MPAQLQTHQIPQLQQMNEMNDIKMRQGMGAKPFQEHLPPVQRPAYPHQQLKPGGSFPVSSPQLLQATSPRIPEHSSPQVDQQNLIPFITKAGTPLQSAKSTFVEETFDEISKKRCPQVSLFSSTVFTGMVLVVVALVFLWFYV